MNHEEEENRIIEIPWVLVYRIAMRHSRLERLKEEHAPSVLIEREEELVAKANSQIRDFAIEHGHFIPSRMETW